MRGAPTCRCRPPVVGAGTCTCEVAAPDEVTLLAQSSLELQRSSQPSWRAEGGEVCKGGQPDLRGASVDGGRSIVVRKAGCLPKRSSAAIRLLLLATVAERLFESVMDARQQSRNHLHPHRASSLVHPALLADLKEDVGGRWRSVRCSSKRTSGVVRDGASGAHVVRPDTVELRLRVGAGLPIHF